MIPWMVGAALAAGVPDFPREVSLDLPPTGISRVAVPAELRQPGVSVDDLRLLLVDATGREVTFARIGTREGTETPLSVHPTALPGVWEITPRDRPIDALAIDLPSSPSAATVTLTSASGAVLAPPVRIWRLESGSHREILLDRPTAEPITVTLAYDGDAPVGEPQFSGLTGRGPAAELRTVPVAGAAWEEGGWRRYEVDLPQSLPIAAVWLDPAEDVFQRRVTAQVSWSDDPSSAWGYQAYDATEVIRQRLGGARVELDRVPVQPGSLGDRLDVRIDGAPALAMDHVILEIPAVWILVRDPGPGPQMLYGDALADGAPISDLQPAIPELLRMSGPVVVPGPVEPNPAFTPPEIVSNLGAPGNLADLARQGFVRDVTGDPGLHRIPLDGQALAHARPDLADVRLVDADNRQIPYVLRRRAATGPPAPLALERTESGGISRLIATLPDPNLPIEAVTLRTDATAFEREVRVLRERGTVLEPVRAFQWTGAGQPGLLTLGVGDRVGERLVVEIDNGDDPPLPISSIEVTWPAWELLASLPDGGARLVYGDLRANAPSYDLALLREQLERRTATPATVGEETALHLPGPPWWDRALVAAGIAALAVGLLAMIAALVRAVPAEQPAPVPDAT